ncbi:response regulator transcription factor [Amnibacterium sp. CER49]|uniref:response regulator transcription factor n=1 Tax=Amnibacterium sp. CER49 TaxID=3039161 RepID=UPI00244CE0C4|nr:response regulator transcription factor [Amnibacterium sp. CER49]MDH2444033.1 response regulator transcription factor [Amnibacterium sp. CER49]
MTVRVLVADDQAMVRAGFVALLAAQPDLEVVGEAADGGQAVALALAERPDVVLMDVRMPVLDGIAATRAILASPGVTARIVMLTTFDIDEYVLEALRAGASGFLLKDARADDLVDAVRVVARGDALLAPSVTRRLIERFASEPAVRPPTTDFGALTPREREVLTLVARGRSNAEIGTDLFIAEQTVKSHVSRLFGKLGARDRVHAVIMAYESGLVLPRAD